MANLVTSEKILPLIQPLLKDVDVESISDSSTISLTKFTTSNRVALRAAVEKSLSNNNITFEDLPKSLGGSFGGTEIYTYDMKKVRFQYFTQIRILSILKRARLHSENIIILILVLQK